MFKINETTSADYQAAPKKSNGSCCQSLRMIGPLFVILIISLFELILGFFRFITCGLFVTKESLENQLALVTGGANGLGKAICIRLAQEKCDIAVVDIDIKNATKTAEEIEAEYKVKCRAYQCDVSDYDAITKLKNNVEREMRTVDILVNNAGLLYSANFISSNAKDVKRTIDVNFTSVQLVRKS